MKSVLIVLLSIANLSLSAQKLMVVGSYSEHVVSMCSQGCEFYEIGVLQLTAPLEIDDAAKSDLIYHRAVTVLATGEVKTIDVLPTVAGPNSNGAFIGKYEKSDRFFPTSFERVTLYEPTISESNYEAFSSGNDYALNFTLSNPTDKTLKLKANIENGEYVMFELPANGSVSFVVPVKNDGWSSNLRLKIVEQVADNEDIYTSAYKHGVSTGLLFFVENYIEVKEISKK